MPLSNPSTPFDADGFADVVSDIRKLYLMINGGGNDLNNNTQDVTQVSDEFEEIEVRVCEDDGEKTMKVMGTRPQ
jgi:hypothetical protein